MAIVSSTGSRTTTVNTFWVAANIMFDLGTGEKKEILLMVNKVEDATVFITEQDADRPRNVARPFCNKLEVPLCYNAGSDTG